MDDHKSVYENEAERYDALVSQEDFTGNIIKAMGKVAQLSGKDIVEMGAGTGRLSILMAPFARSIQIFDSSSAMLEIAAEKLKKAHLDNWHLEVADNRSIPVPNSSADIVLSGWSICYFATWGGEGWKKELFRSLTEMKRILRKDGKIILLETMGTGFETPTPPEHLAEYYQVLSDLDFKFDWFRTDYKFQSLDEKLDLVKFFFGEELAHKVESGENLILPECTGIWWIDNNELILPEIA